MRTPSCRIPGAQALALVALVMGVSGGRSAASGERTIHVAVLDRNGKAVPGLTASSFRGEYRGQPVTIAAATADTEPRRIALLVDTSASLQRRTGGLWAAVEGFVASLAPRHAVMLSTFGGTVEPWSPFTQDLRLLRGALAGARDAVGKGPTALYDALVEMSLAFGEPRSGDALYVLTDGEDTASRRTDEEALQALAGRGVRVFVVLLETPSPQGRLAFSQAAHFAETIARDTGGGMTRFEPTPRTSLGDHLLSLRPALTDLYRLEVAFPKTLDKPRKWSLDAVDARGKRLKVDILYPRLLVPSNEP